MKKMRVKRRVMKSPAQRVMKKILDLKMKSLTSLFAQRTVIRHSSKIPSSSGKSC